MTAQQRNRMIAMQRNNMKSTRDESTNMPQASGSIIRSTNQLSSTGPSLKSPHELATDSNHGSAILRKRRELAIGNSLGSSQRWQGPQGCQTAAAPLRKTSQVYGDSAADPSHLYHHNRVRAIYNRVNNATAIRSLSRKSKQSGYSNNLTNPSIIHKPQSKRSSGSRQGSQQRGGLTVATGGPRGRYKDGHDVNSNYDCSEANQHDGKATTISEEDMKQEMIAAFQKIRLDVYSDILRIKKPQTQAFIASQLLCRLVCAFRGGSQRQVTDTKFPEWSLIQDFVHKRPNVIKFNQEITQLIQHMILSKDYLIQVKSDQLKNHLNKMTKIHQQYFGNKTRS